MCDCWFSFTFPNTIQNLRIRRHCECKRLTTSSSPTDDKYFHEECLQLFVFSMDLVWLFCYQFLRYVQLLFHCEIICIFDGMQIAWVILAHEYRCLQCRRHIHSISQNVCHCLSLHLLRNGSAPFALDQSPCARMIWIQTTFLILLRCKNSSQRFQWCICPCAVRWLRVSPFYLPSNQNSTLEKTIFYQRSILSSLMSVRIRRVSPFYSYFSVCRLGGDWLSWLVFPVLSDAAEGSTTKVLSLHRETKFIIFIIGFEFAVTLSSPESLWVLFDITSEHSVELKWLMLNKR